MILSRKNWPKHRRQRRASRSGDGTRIPWKACTHVAKVAGRDAAGLRRHHRQFPTFSIRRGKKILGRDPPASRPAAAMTATRIFLFLFCAFMLLTSPRAAVGRRARRLRHHAGARRPRSPRRAHSRAARPGSTRTATARSTACSRSATWSRWCRATSPTSVLPRTAHARCPTSRSSRSPRTSSPVAADGRRLRALLRLLRGARRDRALGAAGSRWRSAFARSSFVYARAPYSEALQTLVLSGWSSARSRRRRAPDDARASAWLGVAAGVLVNSKLVYVLLLPSSPSIVIDRRRRGELARAVARAAAGAARVRRARRRRALAQPHQDRHRSFDSGYQIPNGVFSGDLFAGAVRLLALAGKEHVPLLAAAGARRARRCRTAWRRRRARDAVPGRDHRRRHAVQRQVPPLARRLLLGPAPPRRRSRRCCCCSRSRGCPRRSQRGRVAAASSSRSALLARRSASCVQLLGASFYWDHYIRIAHRGEGSDRRAAAGSTENLLARPLHPGVLAAARPRLDAAPPRAQGSRPRSRRAVEADRRRCRPNSREAWSRVRLDWWPLDWIDRRRKPANPRSAGACWLLAHASPATTATRRVRLRRPRSR